MSFGEVDTLNLLYEKLNNLFDESQGYYETILDTNKMYKAGKIADKEFFEKLGDYVVAYSALEFLAIKVIFEMKKSMDKLAGGIATGATQSPGLMPGMGSPGTMGGGMGIPQSARAGTTENPVGQPPSIVSAQETFSQAGNLPSPDPALIPRSSSGKSCSSCGSELRPNAKFCTKCGNKV